MIDIHSHVLWGMDDGAVTLDESLAMARMAFEHGTTGRRRILREREQSSVGRTDAADILVPFHVKSCERGVGPRVVG